MSKKWSNVCFGPSDPNTDLFHLDPINNNCSDFKYTVQNQVPTGTKQISNQIIQKSSDSTCAYAVAQTDIMAKDISAIEMVISGKGCDSSSWGSVFMYGTKLTNPFEEDRSKWTYESTWNKNREVDFMESYFGGSIGPNPGDSVKTNFAGNGNQKTWGECKDKDKSCSEDKFIPFKMSNPWSRHVSAVFQNNNKVFVKNCDSEYERCFSDEDLRALNDPTAVEKLCNDKTSNVACGSVQPPDVTFWQDTDRAKFVTDIWKGVKGCQISVTNLKVLHNQNDDVDVKTNIYSCVIP
jgi:hypothetical protein